MMSLLLAFGKTAKVALVGIAVCIAAYVYGHAQGVQEAEASAEEALREAVARALEQSQQAWEQERAILEEGYAVERVVEEKIVQVEKEAIHLETPDCNSVGAEWVRLRNEAASAVRESMAKDTGVGSKAVPGAPSLRIK